MQELDSGDPHEEWRPVVGSEGVYEVSSLGRVKSLPRKTARPERRASGPNRVAHTKRADLLTVAGKIMTWTPVKGYPRVTLRVNGKTVYREVHRLVALAFLGPPPPGCEVRHKDGNAGNPRLDNLEYGTRAQNIADAKRHGAFKNGASHLTDDLVRQIAARRGDTIKALAKEFGVSTGTIDNIRSGRTWKHLSLDLRSAHPKSPLTEDMVRQIAARHHDSAEVLAKEFGVARATIAGIRSGRRWKHLNLDLRPDYRRRGDAHPARRGKQAIPDAKE